VVGAAKIVPKIAPLDRAMRARCNDRAAPKIVPTSIYSIIEMHIPIHDRMCLERPTQRSGIAELLNEAHF
jgi:ferredoxin-like protein FixX